MLTFISDEVSAQTIVECHTPDIPPPQQFGTPNICWENSYGGSTYNADYIPNPTDPVKIIKLNLHVMQKSDGSENFQANNTDHQAYLWDLENALNDLYGAIPAPLYGGPTGNPFIPDSRIRFEIEQILYHPDDLGYTNNGSLFTSYNFSNYGIEKCNSLNVFIAGRHQPNYNSPAGAGMGLLGENTNFIILFNLYTSWLTHPPGEFGPNFLGGEPWLTNGLIAHEVGHCIGLRHSFSSCSQFSDMDCPQTSSWCHPNTDANCSNNMMGYSTQKLHLTPLQIGHIHEQLSGTWRKKILKSCEFNSAENISINTNETWDFAKVMNGNVTIESGSTLTINCKISMPTGGLFIVKPGGTLIVDGGTLTHSCCDNFWQGIIVEGNYYQHQQVNSNGEYYQGRLILKNGATIKNAREAIRTKGSDGQFRTGGIVQATESNIINCRRAVEFLKYQNFDASNNHPLPNRSFFKECHFEWNDDHLIDLDLESQTALVTL